MKICLNTMTEKQNHLKFLVASMKNSEQYNFKYAKYIHK